MEMRMREQPAQLRWRWLYLSAARALIAGDSRLGAERAGTLRLAAERADELWQILHPRAEGAEHRDLAVAMCWPAYVLRQTIQLELTHRVDPDALKEADGVWWTANTLYNRACFFARAYAITGAREDLDAASRYLRDAIDRAEEPKLMLTMAQCDPVLDLVRAHLTAAQVETLTGSAEPSYEPQRQRGHGSDPRSLSLQLGADS
jgi:hypothetical protein